MVQDFLCSVQNLTTNGEEPIASNWKITNRTTLSVSWSWCQTRSEPQNTGILSFMDENSCNTNLG